MTKSCALHIGAVCYSANSDLKTAANTDLYLRPEAESPNDRAGSSVLKTGSLIRIYRWAAATGISYDIVNILVIFYTMIKSKKYSDKLNTVLPNIDIDIKTLSIRKLFQW